MRNWLCVLYIVLHYTVINCGFVWQTVGRWCHRPSRYSPCVRPQSQRSPQCPTATYQVRRLPHVTGFVRSPENPGKSSWISKLKFSDLESPRIRRPCSWKIVEKILWSTGILPRLRLRSHRHDLRVLVHVRVYIYGLSVSRTSFTRTSGAFTVTCTST